MAVTIKKIYIVVRDSPGGTQGSPFILAIDENGQTPRPFEDHGEAMDFIESKLQREYGPFYIIEGYTK